VQVTRYCAERYGGSGMTSDLTIPDGLEPIATWDAGDGLWIRGPWRERADWATTHIGGTRFIRRIDFHLIDAPLAIVTRYKRSGSGAKYAADGEPALEDPATVPLDELPPAHLLARA
jgi:hypothetical protein